MPLPDAHPASPLSRIRTTAESHPPENYAHYSLFAVTPVRPHAEHLESAVTARGNAFHVCLSLSWHKRQCRLDTEAESNNSSASCLHSWSMFMVWEFLVRVPRFVPHYYYFFSCCCCQSQRTNFSLLGGIRACAAVWLQRCLLPLLFSVPAVFCSCTHACLHHKHQTHLFVYTHDRMPFVLLFFHIITLLTRQRGGDYQSRNKTDSLAIIHKLCDKFPVNIH